MYLLFVCNYLKFHGLKTNDTYTNSNINSHAAITLQKMRKYPETDFYVKGKWFGDSLKIKEINELPHILL